MRFSRMITVVGAHACGELNEVITGGVRDVPGKTMFEKMQYVERHADDLRQFLLNEPRGKVNQCVNLVLPPTTPEADAGFVIIEADYYVPMSGTNTICTGIGRIKVDVAYGGMIYCIVDAESLDLKLDNSQAAKLVEVGERIKRAAAVQIPCVHPDNPDIHTINQTLFAGPLRTSPKGKRSRNTVIVSPGRHDRSPCGTGTCARMAVLHARGLLAEGETFVHESLIGTEFIGRIRGVTTVGGKPAILPTITGKGWITAFHQYVLDPTDPFPLGFRLGDTWPASA
jgi:proline racemase